MGGVVQLLWQPALPEVSEVSPAALDEKPFKQLLTALYKNEWVVYAKRPFGGPEQVINYLGRYTHRIAIGNRRILAVQDGNVTFTYKDYRQDGQQKTMTLAAGEFIRRFLQHCLPPGFQKIRYYGILSTRNRKTKLAALQQSLGYQPPVATPVQKTEPQKTCPACSRPAMQRLGLIPARIFRQTGVGGAQLPFARAQPGTCQSVTHS